MISETGKNIIKRLMPYLDERQRRAFASIVADELGHGGITEVSNVTGISRVTITAGIKELKNPESALPVSEAADKNGRIRSEGGGRKSEEEKQPGLGDAIEECVKDSCYGDPMTNLRYTSRSLVHISEALPDKGFHAGYDTVGKILKKRGYRLEGNKKCLQVGQKHPDRDRQFRFIDDSVTRFMMEDIPTISVDCKKKENVGNFSNTGKEWANAECRILTEDHDFVTPDTQKAAPYGIYDIARNEGYVSVGVSSDTAQFAVNSIRNWWNEMGNERYPFASALYIVCDGGGSNGSRNKLWKVELQKFANETGLKIYVSHFPPGTSKWNKIEHRMFSFITMNWRGKPLVSLMTIISLIEATTTKTGLSIKADVDPNEYEKGIKISKKELEKVNMTPNEFHGDWNYDISPSETDV